MKNKLLRWCRGGFKLKRTLKRNDLEILIKISKILESNVLIIIKKFQTILIIIVMSLDSYYGQMCLAYYLFSGMKICLLCSKKLIELLLLDILGSYHT